MKKRMKHKDTHPNWANLSEYEKQHVRKRNYAERDRLKRVENWKRLAAEHPDDLCAKYSLWKEENPDKVPGMDADFGIKVGLIFKQYFNSGGTFEGFISSLI